MRRKGIGASADARGFTMIEILLVVIILGILSGMVIPRLMGRSDQENKDGYFNYNQQKIV